MVLDAYFLVDSETRFLRTRARQDSLARAAFVL